MDKVVDNCEKEANAHKVESVGRCIHEKMVNFDRVRTFKVCIVFSNIVFCTSKIGFVFFLITLSALSNLFSFSLIACIYIN